MLGDTSKKLLEIIVIGEDSPILPSIGPDGLTYKRFKEYSYEPENTISMLDELTEKGFLKRNDVDHAIFCPQCGSPHVYSKYGCPITDSIHLSKITLIEHPHCGHIGEREKYEKDDRMICPQCGIPLREVDGDPPGDGSRYDWKKIGSAYECEVGGTERFERPEIIHFCQVCDEVFDYREAHYLPLYGYEATEEAYELMDLNPETNKILSIVESVLIKNGFSIERYAEIEGVSGSKHYVSLSSRRGETEVIFDISPEGDPDKLVSLLGKKMDTKREEAILISGKKTGKLIALGDSVDVEVLIINDPNFEKDLDLILDQYK